METSKSPVRLTNQRIPSPALDMFAEMEFAPLASPLNLIENLIKQEQPSTTVTNAFKVSAFNARLTLALHRWVKPMALIRDNPPKLIAMN